MSSKVGSTILASLQPEGISEAKATFTDDVNLLNLKEFPKTSKRRDSDNRGQLELDNILSIIAHVDERGTLASLPKCVADTPDRLSSSKIE